MNLDYQIHEPLLFNPMKHHLAFLREFIILRSEGESTDDIKDLVKELKHLGTSVMDVYNGRLSVLSICNEVEKYLEAKSLMNKESLTKWTGTNNLRIITLSDDSEWTVKYHNSISRFVHFFPARSSPHSFRVKSNTLKSAMLYLILIEKDYISAEDLNKVRSLLVLSPVKDSFDTEAILEMIEILRG